METEGSIGNKNKHENRGTGQVDTSTPLCRYTKSGMIELVELTTYFHQKRNTINAIKILETIRVQCSTL